MLRKVLSAITVACLLSVLAVQVYSGPKTLTIGQAPAAAGSGLEGGIPIEFGDLFAVDAGFLFFVDGDGTIRRVGLDVAGILQGPVITIPRK
jgi:hypothetical protein